MSCYHPLVRFETWEKYKCNDGHIAYKAKVEKLNPGENYEDKEEIEKKLNTRLRNIQIIPCGKCIGCRLEYSKQWATKGLYESLEHKENWFLTLTYDEKNLPEAGTMIDPNTGEEKGQNPFGTLKNTDFTNFIKKLRTYYERKYNHKGIRFMGCGEYGSKGQRPHYHIILFNLPIPIEKLRFHEYNENYEAMYRCTEIEEIWGKGIVVAAEVNWNTCAYVARYITKKVGIPTQKEYYNCLGVEEEFFRMSRRPGIGRAYYEKNKDKIYEKDELIIQKYGGGVMKVRPPKYYDKLYDIENPEQFEKIKKQRKKEQERLTKIKYNQTSKYKKDQLIAEEKTHEAKVQALKRTKV